MMFPGPCEHCPNPDRALWQTECMYKGLYPSHRSFVQSHFDPPCAVDDHSSAKRHSSLIALLITIGVTVVIALICIGIKLYEH